MAPSGDVPDDVRALILRRVESPEFLDVLLLMHGSGDRALKPDEVAGRLRVDEVTASRALVSLRQAGILTVTIDEDAQYRYQPPPAAAETIDALVAHYRDRPQDVIDLIARRPQQKLKLFADAFRIRKDE